MSTAPPSAPWANRITGSGTADPTQLLANPRNPRRHSGTQQEAMQAVLERVGWVTDVIVNQTTGHVVDGHMRVELAMRAGISEIPVKYVELTEAEEAEVLATFDPLTNLAFMDRHALAGLLEEVDTDDDDRLNVLIQGFERHLDNEPFSPSLAPETSTATVTDRDIDRADDKLTTQFTREQKLDSVMCPHCGEEFYVDSH